jgi:hypothetical protein
MNKWLSLILSLSTDNATLRMRAWRGIKASGAATLRDGVYLLPARDELRAVFQDIADEVLAAGGTALLVHMDEPVSGQFTALFDRSADYRELLTAIDGLVASLDTAGGDAQKQVRKLRKAFATLAGIDFFPGAAKHQVETALGAAEVRVARSLSPDEPLPAAGDIPRLRIQDYQQRTWATRRRPWVDRLASAWLIRRFIDPQARMLWLASPQDCPADALGFDFDGASFTHVGALVSLETLIASFQLEQPGLARLAGIVHFLDVGGVQPPEATGIEQVLAGLRASISDDDQLLAAASSIFDGLLFAFQQISKGAPPP